MTREAAGREKDEPAKAKVFISYSRKDIEFANRLEAALEARGFDALIDRTEIYAFEDWWKRIEALIVQADTVVFVLSPDSVTSEVARKEVAFAASLNKRLAPIVCRRVDDAAVPEALAKLNFVFFLDDAGFESSMNRLAEALGTDIAWIRKHTEIGQQARRWASAARPGGWLLRSPWLEQAEHWIAEAPRSAPPPTDEICAFISESRRAATKRRNWLTGGLAAGLVLALALAAVAFVQRDRARRNFELAQQASKSLVFDIAQGLRDVQGMSTDSVRKILETAKATYEQLAAAAPDEPELQHGRTSMLNEFGQTYQTLGDLEQALNVYQEGLVIAERLVASEPANLKWQHDLWVSHTRVGDALVEQGKLDEALKAYRAGLAIAERLAAADPNNPQWQQDIAASYTEIGDVLVAQGKLDEALQAYRAGLAIRERLAAADANDSQR